MPHARQEDFARYPPGDHEQQEGGGGDEVVVHRGIERHFIVNQGGSGLGEGQRENVGEADGEVGGKSAETGSVGADHAGDGVIAHAQKEQRGDRRQDDDGGIGGHVAHDADEDDDGYEQVGGGAGDGDFHQCFEPAGFFRDADADHGSEDDAERREAGKVFHRVFDDAHDVFTVQQVDGGDDFAVGGVYGGYARQRAQPRSDEDNGAEDDEDEDRIGQFVACLFHTVKKTGEETAPGCAGCHGLPLCFSWGLLGCYRRFMRARQRSTLFRANKDFLVKKR